MWDNRQRGFKVGREGGGREGEKGGREGTEGEEGLFYVPGDNSLMVAVHKDVQCRTTGKDYIYIYIHIWEGGRVDRGKEGSKRGRRVCFVCPGIAVL